MKWVAARTFWSNKGNLLRFVFGGGINTVFTYLIYLISNTILGYQLAYFIAYSSGVIFSYWFNAVVVFKVPLSWKGLFSYPIVYIIQYSASSILLGFLVEYFNTREYLAPMIVSFLTLPITYIISKAIIEWSRTR